MRGDNGDVTGFPGGDECGGMSGGAIGVKGGDAGDPEAVHAKLENNNGKETGESSNCNTVNVSSRNSCGNGENRSQKRVTNGLKRSASVALDDTKIEQKQNDGEQSVVDLDRTSLNKALKSRNSQELCSSKRRTVPKDCTPSGGAFAKLEGRFMDSQITDKDELEHFVAYVRHLPCVLGRKQQDEPPNFVCLGDSKMISKEHAILQYDSKLSRFTLTVKGKNGVIVCGRYYRPDEQSAISLSSKDPIKIGNVGFYFLSVNEDKPRKPYGELAVEIFEDLAAHSAVEGGIALGSKEICELLERKYNYFHQLRVKKGNPLMTSFTQALRRCQQVMKAGTIKSSSRPAEKGRVAYLLRSDSTPVGKEVRACIENNSEPTTTFDADLIAEKIKGLYQRKLANSDGLEVN